jgi:uncharacterized protein (TIGR02246 family)
MRLIACIAGILLSLVTLATAQDKSDAQAINEQWMAAFNKGDAAGVTALYTDDATLLPPGASMITGRAEIQKYWAAAAQAVGDMKLTSVKVTPLGADAASDIGTWSLKTKSDKPQDALGKYLVILRKVGSDWKIAVDTWNSDKE